VTFNLVCVGWVFFRADSIRDAFEILGRLGASGSTALVTPLAMLTIAGMLGVQYLPREPAARLRESFGRLGPVLQGAVLALGLFVITTLGAQGVTPFIYFRF
jgi:alginate O-acetyltransferase complex protein AlgI